MSDMVRMGLRPASLALAAALCFGSSAQAADDPLVAQASVTLSGLSFQLIDLTPGDGIAPSLSFQTQGIIDTSNSVYDEASDSWLHSGPTYSNSLLPSTPVNYITADGMSTVTSTANSVTLQSQVQLSQILPSLTPPNAEGTDDYIYLSSMSGTDLAVGNAFPGEFQQFTLSAGSALVVRGSLSGSYTLDGTALKTGLEASGYTDWSIYHTGAADASFVMAAQFSDLSAESAGFEGLIGNQVNGVFAQLVDNGGTFLNSADVELLLQTANSRDFEFTLTNLGDTDMTGLLALNLGTYSDLSVSANRISLGTPPIDIPAIPEPSTYALMGLGLVGITAVARRRRHTA